VFNSQNRASGAYRSNHNNICKQKTNPNPKKKGKQKTPFSENPKMKGQK
jgi:hypothetical protein